MSIAFIADTHIGLHRKWGLPSQGVLAPVNTRAVDILKVLANARQQAERMGVTDLFVLGDVFDTSCPSPQLIAEAQHALASTKMQVHLMPGNHDAHSDAPGDHALVSMHGTGLRVYERPDIVYTDQCAVYLVPYRPGRADDYLPEVVRSMGSTGHDPYTLVLGLHLGLRDATTPAWLQGAHDSYPIMDLHKLGSFDLVAAGNWHVRNSYNGGTVWQVGALVPTGFDNPGITGYGSLLVYDGHKVVAHELPGPRFVRAANLVGARDALRLLKRNSVWPTYISVRCKLSERQEVQEMFELFDHKEYEVLTDKEAAEEAARTAATAAAYASTDGIQAAVRAYVERMALPADIDRGTVLGKALDYVAGASS